MQCLILRGSQGTAVRCWSPGVLLNGAEFTDDWIAPGDRLNLGPIELELLSSDASFSGAETPCTNRRWPAPPQIAHSRPSRKTHRDIRRLNQGRVRRLCQALRDANGEIGGLQDEIDNQHDRLEHLLKRIVELESAIDEAASATPPAADDQTELNSLCESSNHEAASYRGFCQRVAELVYLDHAEPPTCDDDSLGQLMERVLEGVQRRMTQIEAEREQNRHDFELQLERQREQLDEQQRQLRESQEDMARREAELERARADLQHRWNELETEFHARQAAASDQAADSDEQNLAANKEQEALSSELQTRQDQLDRDIDLLRREQELVRSRQQELDEAQHALEQERREFERERDDWHNTRSEVEAKLAGQIEKLNSPPFTELDELDDEYEYEDELYDEAEDDEAEDDEAEDDEAEDVEAEDVEAEDDKEEVAEVAEIEISFSEPDSAAPVDTASILGRFRVDDDDEPTRPGADDSAAASDADSAGEGDDAIDDYMDRLLNRVVSESNQVEPPLDPSVSEGEPQEESPVAAADENSATGSEQSKQPELRSREAGRPLIPGVAPPELDLEMMRDIANETARSAINRHSQKVWLQAAFAKWCIAFASFGTGGVLLFWTEGIFSFFGLAAIVALGISVFWLLQGFWLTRFAWQSRTRRKRPLKPSRAKNTKSDATPENTTPQKDVPKHRILATDQPQPPEAAAQPQQGPGA